MSFCVLLYLSVSFFVFLCLSRSDNRLGEGLFNRRRNYRETTDIHTSEDTLKSEINIKIETRADTSNEFQCILRKEGKDEGKDKDERLMDGRGWVSSPHSQNQVTLVIIPFDKAARHLLAQAIQMSQHHQRKGRLVIEQPDPVTLSPRLCTPFCSALVVYPMYTASLPWTLSVGGVGVCQ